MVMFCVFLHRAVSVCETAVQVISVIMIILQEKMSYSFLNYMNVITITNVRIVLALIVLLDNFLSLS